MDARFEFTLDPLKEANRLKKGMRNTVIRKSLNKAAAVVKAQVEARAPRRHGYLAKSFRIRLKNYKNSDKWVAIIGPKSSLTRKRKGKVIRPSNYARLVEEGTQFAKARPYLRPALAVTKAQFLETLRAKIKQEVEAALKKK